VRAGKIAGSGMRLLAPVALTIAAMTALAQPAPRFEDYPVASVFQGKTHRPEFGDPKQYSGTDLRCFGGDSGDFDYSKYKPNFAGHYVIEACTCGSGCHYLYMWDAVTGKVSRNFPAMPIDVGPFSDSPIEYRGEEYRVDSSLLILDGCIEDTCDCATRYYRWDGSRFRLLQRVSKPRVACPFK
jgi:hypothetical protein